MRCESIRILAWLLLICSAVPALAADLEDLEIRREIAVTAEEAYRRGVDDVAGSAAARTAFLESAERWQTAIDLGADGADAFFNLGNALLRADEVGEAILAFRRAERLAPDADDIAANLAEARRRVDRPIEADATDLSFSSVASWWSPLTSRSRLTIASIAWILFWTLLFVRRGMSDDRRRAERESVTAGWRAGLVLTFTLALVGGATVVADVLLPNWRPVGVVTASEAILRSGNGSGFEAVVIEPLSEGVEFAIEEARPGWWRVRLPDETVGWISMDDAESISRNTPDPT
ncbi:MAG: hypothetical protein CMJ23_10720 [Phycisphaerae bacterium]|nr:hypothetical protein [Phycisphaerae bacterium]